MRKRNFITILSITLAIFSIAGLLSVYALFAPDVEENFTEPSVGSILERDSMQLPIVNYSDLNFDLDDVNEAKVATIFNTTKLKSDYNLLLIKRYKEIDILSAFPYNAPPNFITFLHDFNELYPVECFRYFENSMPYALYKTEEGGLVLTYYMKNGNAFVSTYIFYVKNELSFADFESLKFGDSIDIINEIDKGFAVLDELQKVTRGTYTLHLTKDGIVKVNIEPENLLDYENKLVLGPNNDRRIISVEFFGFGEEVFNSEYSKKTGVGRFDLFPGDYDLLKIK